jgi:MFS family permease
MAGTGQVPAGAGAPRRLFARLAPQAYPPSFRERYGVELTALVEDTGAGPRVLVDLAVGAAKAWLRPVLGVEPDDRVRRRRLASVSTVWVCWCATFVATPALLRALEDPPPTGFDPYAGGWLVVHDTILTALAVGWAIVLVVGVPVGLVALRRHQSVRRVVAVPVLLLVLCALMFVPLQLYAASHWIAAGRSAADSELPVWWVLLALAFVVVLGVDALWGTMAGATALRRAGLDAAGLRLPTFAAAAVVLPMACVVVALTVVTFGGAHVTAAGPLAPLVVLTVLVLLGALAVAVTSAARGLSAVAAAGTR